MTAVPPPLPSLAALEGAIGKAFAPGGSGAGFVHVVGRRRLRMGTHGKELVEARVGEGAAIRVFCKAGSAGEAARRVVFEASVFESVLAGLPIQSARFHGLWHDRDGDLAFLLLEDLSDALRLKYFGEWALVAAAEWIGRFHALCGADGAPRHSPRVLDDGPLAQGIDAALRGIRDIGVEALERTARIVDGFLMEGARVLRSGPVCMGHGDYFPKNILVRGVEIIPVDWESAALMPGEVDLASLTEGWPPESQAAAVWAYCTARWGADPPEDFGRRLELARVYNLLRVMADKVERRGDLDSAAWSEALANAATRAGLP